ncbi:unnamed protein product [Closterium sp. Yama58-4]|nr:unnamed protein product [Closterium sp. Yama58-4]
MEQASIRATCDDLHQLHQPATADPLATLLGDDARWFGWSREGRLRCALSQHEFPIRAEHVAGLVAVAQSQDASLESCCDSSQQSQPQHSQPQLSQDAWAQQQWRSVRQHVRSKAFAAAVALAEAMERAAPHIVAHACIR